MFGTIRKHQKWLWGVIVTLTVLSFLVFFSPYSRVNSGGGGGTANYGSIAGERISGDDYYNAQKEVLLRYFFSNGGRWPDDPARRNPNFDVNRETYIWLLLIRKQEQMGIHIATDQVALFARQMLAQFQKAGISSPDVFLKQVLEPRGIQLGDFERYVRHTLGVEELAAMVGVSGKLATPEEVKGLYVREHQEMATTALFFSASNYLAGITATPQQLSQFYSNNIANYRIPERVQVSYVKFDLTNYLSEANTQMAKLTNLEEEVELAYQKDTNVLQQLKAKDLADAKVKYRELRLKDFQRQAAGRDARDFANKVFDISPVQPENLAIQAKSNGLPVHVTAPFDQDGPKDLDVGSSFVKAAFNLSPTEDPFNGPLLGENAVYVIAYNKKLPSEIPPFDQIREQVTADYKNHVATGLARQAGMGFYQTLTNGLAQKKSFSSIALEAKLKPIELPPFSLSTRTLPDEVGDRLSLDQLKQLAFSTPPGTVSEFRPTADGGVIFYVRSLLPIDETKMQTQMSSYLAYVRSQRQREAFDTWFSREAQHDLHDTPLFQQKQPPALSSRKS